MVLNCCLGEDNIKLSLFFQHQHQKYISVFPVRVFTLCYTSSPNML